MPSIPARTSTCQQSHCGEQFPHATARILPNAPLLAYVEVVFKKATFMCFFLFYSCLFLLFFEIIILLPLSFPSFLCSLSFSLFSFFFFFCALLSLLCSLLLLRHFLRCHVSCVWCEAPQHQKTRMNIVLCFNAGRRFGSDFGSACGLLAGTPREARERVSATVG